MEYISSIGFGTILFMKNLPQKFISTMGILYIAALLGNHGIIEFLSDHLFRQHLQTSCGKATQVLYTFVLVTVATSRLAFGASKVGLLLVLTTIVTHIAEIYFWWWIAIDLGMVKLSCVKDISCFFGFLDMLYKFETGASQFLFLIGPLLVCIAVLVAYIFELCCPTQKPTGGFRGFDFDTELDSRARKKYQ